MRDSPDSPRPLKNPYPPRPEGASTHGYIGAEINEEQSKRAEDYEERPATRSRKESDVRTTEEQKQRTDNGEE